MPRVCTICAHPDRREIETCLVDSVPFRIIASRFGTSSTSLQRHKTEHLPGKIVQAKAAQEIEEADDLLSQVQALRRKSLELLDKAERAGDYRTALAGVKEARACIETLLEVEGKLDRKPTFNITLSPQWIEMRTVIVTALASHPEARQAVTTALETIAGGPHRVSA